MGGSGQNLSRLGSFPPQADPAIFSSGGEKLALGLKRDRSYIPLVQIEYTGIPFTLWIRVFEPNHHPLSAGAG